MTKFKVKTNSCRIMADRKFIESLNIEDNVFELMENCVIGYLVHYCAPYTGAGEHEIPAGTKFCIHGPMNGDTMYMHLVEENDNTLLDVLTEKEQKNIPMLSDRLAGFSFFITEKQMKDLSLKFISGSRERSLEIFELIRKANSEFVRSL